MTAADARPDATPDTCTCPVCGGTGRVPDPRDEWTARRELAAQAAARGSLGAYVHYNAVLEDRPPEVATAPCGYCAGQGTIPALAWCGTSWHRARERVPATCAVVPYNTVRAHDPDGTPATLVVALLVCRACAERLPGAFELVPLAAPPGPDREGTP
jgi:hypothetical protein